MLSTFFLFFFLINTAILSETGEPLTAVEMKWLLVCCCWLGSASSSTLFNLTILHTNDIHSRYEEANVYGDRCSQQQSVQGQCYGGFPRLVYQTRQIRQREPNSIYLDAGDLFQGTIWHTIHRWKAASHFANLLNLTAMVTVLKVIAYPAANQPNSHCQLIICTVFSNQCNSYRLCLIHRSASSSINSPDDENS